MQEEAAVFSAAMCETGEALIHASEFLLAPQNSPELGFGGLLEEYAQYVCQSMGMWGYNHYNTLPEPRKPHYLNLVGCHSRQCPSLLIH
jgi:hypothetical protein